MHKKLNGLKILHIGNIANNAYNNAKILNKLGIINDVLSPDYYHIMGCPEWEELDIQPNEVNDFDPKWYKVNEGYERPEWFAQGVLSNCLEYLYAKNIGDTKRQKVYWCLLGYNNKTKRMNLNYIYIKMKYRLRRAISWRIKALLNIKDKSQYVPNHDLIRDFEQRFPDRSDKLTPEEMDPYKYTYRLQEVLNQYDYVFCYGASTILPVLVGYYNFVGFEHGTLRDIPWGDNTFARLTALSYSKAKSILMTNADSVPQAKKLNQKIFYGQHGFIIQDAQRKIEKYSKKSIINDYLNLNHLRKYKILQSTRQDWSTKGNNKFLEAISRLKREEFNDFDILLADWGNDVELTKKFIHANSLEDHVTWIPTLSKPQLLKLYTEVDILIDQFNIPCIGSTPLEIFSVKGAALITSLDNDIMTTFYGRTIPLINCTSSDDIYTALKSIFKEEIDLKKIKEDCYQWLLETHSEERIAKTLLESQGITI